MPPAQVGTHWLFPPVSVHGARLEKVPKVSLLALCTGDTQSQPGYACMCSHSLFLLIQEQPRLLPLGDGAPDGIEPFPPQTSPNNVAVRGLFSLQD